MGGTRPRPGLQRITLAVLCWVLLSTVVLVRAVGSSRSEHLFQSGERYSRSGNMARAFRYYLQAAQLGDVRAELQVALQYEQGKGVLSNDRQAFYWYNLAAQKNEDGRAVHGLARCYEFGIGVKPDRARAIELYNRAANLGVAEAAESARWLSVPGNVSFRNEQEHQLWLGYQRSITAIANCYSSQKDAASTGRRGCSIEQLQTQKDALFRRLPEHLRAP